MAHTRVNDALMLTDLFLFMMFVSAKYINIFGVKPKADVLHSKSYPALFFYTLPIAFSEANLKSSGDRSIFLSQAILNIKGSGEQNHFVPMSFSILALLIFGGENLDVHYTF